MWKDHDNTFQWCMVWINRVDAMNQENQSLKLGIRWERSHPITETLEIHKYLCQMNSVTILQISWRSKAKNFKRISLRKSCKKQFQWRWFQMSITSGVEPGVHIVNQAAKDNPCSKNNQFFQYPVAIKEIAKWSLKSRCASHFSLL